MIQPIVSALCYTLAGVHDPRPLPRCYNPTVRFVLAQLGRAPRTLGLGLGALTGLLECSGLLFGARFTHLAPERRLRVVALWRRLPLGRDLIRFYESLTVFHLFADAL